MIAARITRPENVEESLQTPRGQRSDSQGIQRNFSSDLVENGEDDTPLGGVQTRRNHSLGRGRMGDVQSRANIAQGPQRNVLYAKTPQRASIRNRLGSRVNRDTQNGIWESIRNRRTQETPLEQYSMPVRGGSASRRVLVARDVVSGEQPNNFPRIQQEQQSSRPRQTRDFPSIQQRQQVNEGVRWRHRLMSHPINSSQTQANIGQQHLPTSTNRENQVQTQQPITQIPQQIRTTDQTISPYSYNANLQDGQSRPLTTTTTTTATNFPSSSISGREEQRTQVLAQAQGPLQQEEDNNPDNFATTTIIGDPLPSNGQTPTRVVYRVTFRYVNRGEGEPPIAPTVFLRDGQRGRPRSNSTNDNTRVVLPPTSDRDQVVLNIANGGQISPEELLMIGDLISQSPSPNKGFSAKTISQLKTTSFEVGHPSTHNQTECSICYNEFWTGQQVHQLPCGHIYDACIKKWFSMSKCCPLCKKEYTSQEIQF